MSQVAGPYGLLLAKTLGDLPFSGGMHTYRLTANNPTGFFFGDPVGLDTNGNPVPVAVTPVAGAAVSANNPIGVFMGCSYQDPVWGFVNRQMLPAGAVTAGFTNISMKIADWPWLVMQIQANGPVNLNQIGKNAALIVGAPAPGNVNTGNSTVALNAASIGAGAAAVRIYDFVYTGAPSPGASSQPGDPFTDVLVVWCPTVHRFQIAAGL